jgi:hypothetical protein
MQIQKTVRPQGFQPVELKLTLESQAELDAVKALSSSISALALYVAAGFDGEPSDSSALPVEEKALYDVLYNIVAGIQNAIY